MQTPDFPNGFESWQRTHFEVVEVLCYMRNLEEGQRSKSFDEIEEFVWSEVREGGYIL